MLFATKQNWLEKQKKAKALHEEVVAAARVQKRRLGYNHTLTTEDIALETEAKLLRSPKYSKILREAPATLNPGFFHEATRNVILDLFRRRRTRSAGEREELDDEIPATENELVEQWGRLKALLLLFLAGGDVLSASIPQAQRDEVVDVVALAAGGFTEREIANELTIPKARVHKWLEFWRPWAARQCAENAMERAT